MASNAHFLICCAQLRSILLAFLEKYRYFLHFHLAFFTNWYLMNITNPEGAVTLSNAEIFCQEQGVLTGFKFETDSTSASFR
jgi:hypothetical protein